MRIAVIAGPHIPVPPAKYGGIEQIIYYLLKGLAEDGHEPILLGSADSQVDCEVIPIIGQAADFPKTKAELPRHARLVEENSRYVERILRTQSKRFDIIHSHGLDLRNFQHVPNITTLHGPIGLENLDYYLARKQLYFASISKNQQAGCPDLSYAGVVYNGLDPASFPIVEKPQDYLCFLGRFDAQKNPHLAIQLAIHLGMPIKIAGKIDFQGETYFKREIKPYLKHPLVEYLGELDFKAKVELLSNARCNLHPTGFREPFGLTVLEAAYCGTPTLAIARGSMPELIEEGRTGILLEDFVEGYHYIQRCFEMDRLYIANRARLLFNYHTMARDYAKAYRHVIETFAKQKASRQRKKKTVYPSKSHR